MRRDKGRTGGVWVGKLKINKRKAKSNVNDDKEEHVRQRVIFGSSYNLCEAMPSDCDRDLLANTPTFGKKLELARGGARLCATAQPPANQ